MASDGTGTAWDETLPTDSALVSDLPIEIREVRKQFMLRLEKEHDTLSTSSAGGEHKAGSAKAYYENASFPTKRPNTTSTLDTSDKGRLLVRYDSGQLWYWDGSAWQYAKATHSDSVADGILEKEHIKSGFTKGILPYAILEERQTDGTDAGDAAAGTWNVRTLTTEVSDAGSIVSLAAGVFTLGNGTYRIRAIAPAYKVDLHRIRIYNNTDGVALVYGNAAAAPAGTGVITYSELTHEFTITGGDTEFQLEHYTQTVNAGDGLGIAVSAGVTEIYSRVEIWKLL